MTNEIAHTNEVPEIQKVLCPCGRTAALSRIPNLVVCTGKVACGVLLVVGLVVVLVGIWDSDTTPAPRPENKCFVDVRVVREKGNVILMVGVNGIKGRIQDQKPLL